jgi:hypothetical protein
MRLDHSARLPMFARDDDLGSRLKVVSRSSLENAFAMVVIRDWDGGEITRFGAHERRQTWTTLRVNPPIVLRIRSGFAFAGKSNI